jgi:hypothetical protein
MAPAGAISVLGLKVNGTIKFDLIWNKSRLKIWLKYCKFTIFSGEQSGKPAVSAIRRRFVPALT